MTVLGENPGEEYFDMQKPDAVGTHQTRVAWITGISVAGGNADLIVAPSDTSSVTIGGTHTGDTYFLVGGW